MPLNQSIENARAERIGAEGIAAADFAAALARTGEALEWLRARHADGSLPLLRLPAARDDLAGITKAARRLADGASDIVILGTGGSSLGGQTLAQLAGYAVPGVGALRQGPRLHFMDNLDADTFGTLLAKLPLASSRFVAISKSGGTAETLMQTIAALTAVKDAGLAARIPELFLGLTEPAKSGKPNGLRTLLSEHGVAMLDHDTGVGGRYSVLTNVGLLPAALVGLDLAAIRAGAARSLAPILEQRPPAEVPAAIGAALAVSLAETRGKSISVLMAYADRLERFTRWYAHHRADGRERRSRPAHRRRPRPHRR
jgi:glucose-6-phosphate isomerase